MQESFSIQIAPIRNHYLIYPLIILELLLRSCNLFPEHTEDLELQRMQFSIQLLADSIVKSAPFGLGSRTELSTLDDMVDWNLEMPGYHCISPEERPELMKNVLLMLRDEHMRHAVAQ